VVMGVSPPLGLKHFILAAEGRKLYRSVLRALRGVETETASSVRQSARDQFAMHAHERDVEKIKILLIDGEHSLKQMREYLGTATRRA